MLNLEFTCQAYIHNVGRGQVNVRHFRSRTVYREGRCPILEAGSAIQLLGEAACSEEHTSVKLEAFLGLLLDGLVHGDQFSFWILLLELACVPF